MNVTKNQIDELNATITVEVCKADYAADVEKQLKRYQQSAQIPGFRKGKAPFAMIKKVYGDSLIGEAVNNVLATNLNKYIKENDLNIMGQPLPNTTIQKPIDMEAETMEFVYDIALAPEMNVELSKREKVVMYNIDVNEDMVNKQIEIICQQNGSLVDVEEATDNEFIKGEVIELGKENGVKNEEASLSLYYIKDEDTKAAFKGKKIGDVVEYDALKAHPNPTDLAAMLGIKKEELEGFGPMVSFTIKEMKRHQAATLGEELYARTYGAEVVKTEEEFKAKVKSDIENQLKGHSDYRFTIDAKAKLLKKNADVQLPEEFLKRWILAVNEKMTAEEVEKDFEGFRDEFKWQLIKSAILKSANQSVEEEDVKACAREVAAAQLQQYGLYGMTDEQLDGFAERLLKDERQRENLLDRAVENKVFAIVKESVKLDEQSISMDDFQKLFEK